MRWFARRVFKGIISAYRLGFTVVEIALRVDMQPASSLLRLEDLDRSFAERTATFDNPSVLKTIQHDYLEYIHFFSKLALAIGHLHFGDVFSRSATGRRLRQNMNTPTMEDVHTPEFIWPDIAAVERVLEMFARADHHTLAIMEGEVPMLIVSLFGELGAVMPLGGERPVLAVCTVWRCASKMSGWWKQGMLEWWSGLPDLLYRRVLV